MILKIIIITNNNNINMNKSNNDNDNCGGISLIALFENRVLSDL